ncbi:PilN domain-containing protein [Marinobacter hydrocarbonoclasticus]|nr:PilN domain-containing protein [Marinobacter nauticus]
MKRRVNLYSPSLLPKRDRLTLPRLLLACAAVVVLSVLTAMLLRYQASTLDQQLAEAQAEQNRVSAELSQVTALLRAHQPRPDLVAQVEQARQRLEGFRRLADVLDRDELLTEPGFSSLMADLATSADNQVWLERFQLARDQVLLSGQARRAAAVPAWLDKLGQQPSLQGRAVSQLSIQGEAGKPVRFTAGHGLVQEEAK